MRNGVLLPHNGIFLLGNIWYASFPPLLYSLLPLAAGLAVLSHPAKPQRIKPM
jgi:hypothetical protein